MQTQQILNSFDRVNLQQSFRDAKPFRHVVIDNFLCPEIAEEIAQHFPHPEHRCWNHYNHVNERLRASSRREYYSDITQHAFNSFNSDSFIQFLEDITGLKGLKGDETLEGGGLIYTKRDGYLNVHADFNLHPFKKNWQRKLNLLLYLNRNWKDEYGGHLELWNEEMTQTVKRVAPTFNRAILFETTKFSYHGYPAPLRCPGNLGRKSLGIYYYAENHDAPPILPTDYQPLPSDSAFKKVAIRSDNKLIGLYDWLKRKTRINDSLGSHFMKYFS